MDEYQGKCEVTEKVNKEFIKCAIPTNYRATKHIDWWLCKHHVPYALVAGWEPKEQSFNEACHKEEK